MSSRTGAMQVKALLWEEGRVGGSIAGVSLFVGLLMLLGNWMQLGESAWRRDEFLVEFATIGIPILVALLLVLNPDSSGHMVGGFSKRILRLPVPTYVAVAIALLARTVLVFVVSASMVGISSAMFAEAPRLAAAGVLTVVYLAAQLFDWLRGVVSGLISLLLCAVAAMVVYAWWPNTPAIAPVAWAAAQAQRAPALWFAAPAIGLLLAFAVSAFAVHAQRIGRTYGVPEIWEWPQRLQWRRAFQARPFSGPIAAQVWFELRRARGVLPIGTIAGTALIVGAVWLQRDPTDKNQSDYLPAAFVMAPPFALLLASILHGLVTRVIGFRRRLRRIGYEYMQPLTDSQLAHAIVIAHAISLAAALIAASVIHFIAAGALVYAPTIAKGLHAGMISPREVIWIFLGRILVLGIFAWLLLSIGTRVFRRVLAVIVLAVTMFVLAVTMTFVRELWYDLDDQWFDLVFASFCGLLTLATIIFAVWALVRAVVPVRVIAYWAVAWLLAAWLLHYPVAMIHVIDPIPFEYTFVTTLYSFGYAAAVPLVFFATLFDVRCRRATKRLRLDPRQHRVQQWSLPSIAAATIVCIAAIWLGWPAKPSFFRYRHSLGLAANPHELDVAYADVPYTRNAANKYLSLAERAEAINRAFTIQTSSLAEFFIPSSQSIGDRDVNEIFNAIVRGHSGYRDKQFDARGWAMAEARWRRVTSMVAPRLQEIGRDHPERAHYPVNLSSYPKWNSEHLWHLRGLSTQCAYDAVHWIVARRTDRAVDSILAQIALSKSLTNEPVLESQAARLAILDAAATSVETLLNRSVPSASDLTRLHRAIEEAVPPPSQGMFLEKAMDSQVVFDSSRYPLLHDDGVFDLSDDKAVPAFALCVFGIIVPAGSLGLDAALEADALARTARRPWPEYTQWKKGREDYYSSTLFFSPTAQFSAKGLLDWYESEWRTRTQLQLALTAIAVEQFRVAQSGLPDSLDQLVPEYLPAVPGDYYGGEGVPLKYSIRESGEYAVYSVFRNMTDEGGKPVSKGGDWANGDLYFSVAPMSFRTGPQVAAN